VSAIGFTAEVDQDDDGRAAEPLFISDGEVHIEDSPEFYELTGSIAAQFRDGVLFVLRRDTLKWVNVEEIPSTKRGGKVVAIKGDK